MILFPTMTPGLRRLATCVLLLGSAARTQAQKQRALPPPSADELEKVRAALPGEALVTPAKPRRILLFSRCQGAAHGVIPLAAEAFEMMGATTGAFGIVRADEMTAFDPGALDGFDAVLLNNTTRLTFDDPARRAALLAFVRGGKGLIGTHAATDNFYTWPEAAAMIGGQFDGHPWRANGTWAVKLDEDDHPVNAAFGGRGFALKDEIYQIKGPYSRETHRVLLSLDMSDPRNRAVGTKGIRRKDNDFAIAWLRREGEGRVFYCSLGHNRTVYFNRAVLGHYLAGIQYALGDLEVDDRPSAAVSVAQRDAADDPFEALGAFDYGGSSAAVAAIDARIRAARTAAARREIEAGLIAVLGRGDTTPDAKDVVLRCLRRVGRAACVAPVAELLPDPRLSLLAAQCLAGIGDGSARSALRQAADTPGTGAPRLHALKALAQLADRSSVRRFAAAAAEGDVSVAAVGLAGLARLGTPESAAVLMAARVPADLQTQWQHARLECAHRLGTTEDGGLAGRLYRQVLSADTPDHIRLAALRGLTQVEGAGAVGEVVSYMGSDAPRAAGTGSALLAAMTDDAVVPALTAVLPRLQGAARLGVINALGRRRDPAATATLLAELEDRDKARRQAALQALVTIGDADAVPTLVQLAAGDNAGGGARDGLARMTGEGVSERFLTELERLPATRRAALLQVAAARRDKGLVPLLQQWVSDADETLRLACWEAAGSNVPGDQAAPFVTQYLQAGAGAGERSIAEVTVARLLRSDADIDGRTKPLIAALPDAAAEMRASLLRCLGRLGGPAALRAVSANIASPDADVSNAAVRALAAWSTPEAVPVLHKVVETTDNPVHRVLAYRGHVALLGLPSTRPAAETVQLYRDALALAPSAQERPLVFSGLGKVHHPAALRTAVALSADAAVRDDAVTAALQIARSLPPSQATVVQAELGRLRDLDVDAGMETAIRDAIAKSAWPGGKAPAPDWVSEWQIAGPFGERDVPPEKLLGTRFGPELENAAITWTTVRGDLNPKKGYQLNLEKLVGGQNRVAYARAFVYAPERTNARLEIGSDDGNRIWLNGDEVHANDAHRAVKPNSDRAEVVLKTGWNGLLMKVTQHGGHWGACLRVRARNGETIPGIICQGMPPTPAADE